MSINDLVEFVSNWEDLLLRARPYVLPYHLGINASIVECQQQINQSINNDDCKLIVDSGINDQIATIVDRNDVSYSRSLSLFFSIFSLLTNILTL